MPLNWFLLILHTYIYIKTHSKLKTVIYKQVIIKNKYGLFDILNQKLQNFMTLIFLEWDQVWAFVNLFRLFM